MRPLVVTTLFTYLELEDVLAATAPFYTDYQFRTRRPAEEIAARVRGRARRSFCAGFSAARPRRFDLVPPRPGRAPSKNWARTRERIVKALNYLEEQGDLTLKVAGLRQGYRIKSRPADAGALKRTLVERFQTREKNDLQRVAQVVSLAEGAGCIVRRLLAHFGEERDRDCGHCSVCLGQAPQPISDLASPAPEIDLEAMRELRREHPRALGSARQLARFLCGLTSPQLTVSKLGKHPLFGSQAGVRFRDVARALKAS